MRVDPRPAEPAMPPPASTPRPRGPDPPRARVRRRRAIGQVLTFLWPAALLLICVVGIIIRLTVKDRWPVLNTCYYVTPPVVLAGLALLAAVWLLLRRRWWTGGPALLLALVCTFWYFQTSWAFHPVPPPGHGPRVMYWNIARGMLGWDRVFREIRAYDPDVLALTEAPRDPDESRRLLAAQFPDHHVCVGDQGLAVVSKYPILHRGGQSLRSFGWYLDCEVGAPDQRFQLVVVDIKAHPFRVRLRAMNALYDVLDQLPAAPTLVVGDFNTPADSVYLDDMRLRFANAFALAGNGPDATWPMPLPVLSLDQAWFRDLQVPRCDFGWSLASDHRAIHLELDLPQPTSSPNGDDSTSPA